MASVYLEYENVFLEKSFAIPIVIEEVISLEQWVLSYSSLKLKYKSVCRFVKEYPISVISTSPKYPHVMFHSTTVTRDS